jgi:hypothetical protein
MSCKTIFLRGFALIFSVLFLLSPDTFACFLPVIVGLWILSNQKPDTKEEQELSSPREGVSGSTQAPGGADDLVGIIRFAQDKELRRKALQKLKELGLVEEL